MTRMPELVAEVARGLGARLPVLCDVAADLHAHPEIRFTEHHAAQRLTDELDRAGFAVTRGFAGLDTAFVGRWSTPGAAPDAPTVAIFCEYDALEEIGHACGHNLIAAFGLGAAMLLRDALLAAPGTDAHVVVIGSPGEEGAAGKVPMIEGGVLDGIDVAIMAHPADLDAVGGTSLSRIALDVEFEGRAAHAANDPADGVNALDAATLSLNAIGLLRQQLPDAVRVHAIVTDGGQAPNIIPEHTALRCFVRDVDQDRLLANIVPRVRRCFEAGALATGCTVTIEERTPPYHSMRPDPVLADVAAAAFAAVGRVPQPQEVMAGSTDMGNVSRIVPAIHPMVCLEPGVHPHTREFAAAAAGPNAEKTIADGAVILAATALAVFRDPSLRDAAVAGFGIERRPVDDPDTPV
ncbi:amidohydrolase [Rhodococcus rhodnii LMG 5362]|uniref:Peptidase M20 domain-containing protein 2 n=1 Tax=Rhodococcus rhodnii LMG 5362 TaxID=1273125 RepID=R7WN81_9NOCA|nr:amidohydrolase [Rhodococcus rhodnii LMG 5362]